MLHEGAAGFEDYQSEDSDDDNGEDEDEGWYSPNEYGNHSDHDCMCMEDGKRVSPIR
jgi:hypothetical protein